MSEEFVLYRVENHVAVISINRPERHNAMHDEASAVFALSIEKALMDDDVRVLLLRGEGKSFCSGRDMSVLGVRKTGLSDFEHLTRSQERKFRIIESRKPVIAAVKGYAIGGGFELALHADMRVASDDAKMSLPEINYGILTDGGGSSIVAAIAGPSRAKYLLMSGAQITAAQAHDWGLVDFVTSSDELDEFALGLAKDIAAKPPVHLAAAKYLVDGVYGERVRRVIKDELMVQTALYKTEDYKEARAALREDRKPKYTGR